MKRIAIFCDGTWNRFDARHPSNVVKLFGAVAPRAPDGTEQIALYREGVGTGDGKSGLARAIDRFGGGAFGWGLTENIRRIYRALAQHYSPGDQIYVFGFSRGAYTARSLVGLIRNCGIPAAGADADTDEAIAIYRSRAADASPDAARSLKFRSRYAPHIVTSETEAAWRHRNRLPAGHRLRIAYLGLWDTVGALGVPAYYRVLSRVFNRRYEFHDLALSSMVAAARHAVAIDERRRTFPPALWDNLDRLNGSGFGTARRFLQEWVPGEHSAVGGGGEETGLSDGALLWIAQGAGGLAYRPESLAPFTAGADPLAPLAASRAPAAFPFNLLRLNGADRVGPELSEDISPAARTRWQRTDYRPRPLVPFASVLDAPAPGTARKGA